MSEAAQTQTTSPAPSTVRRVLIVDDEESIRELFAGLFPPPAYSITGAASGQEALDVAQKETFDLAFVDYYLGTMNGVEVARRMRPTQPDMKIVLISGYPVGDRAFVVEQATAQAFLSKPFSVAAVRALADRLLGNDTGPSIAKM